MEKKAIPCGIAPLHASLKVGANGCSPLPAPLSVGLLVVCLLLFEMLLPPGTKDPRLFPQAGDLFNGLFSLRANASIPGEAIAHPQPGAILHPQRYANALNRSTCPENLQALIAQMLPDLPGYANRVLRRSSISDQVGANSSSPLLNIYVITAGNPEFEPLPLGAGRSTTGRPSTRQENSPPSRGEERIAGEQPFAPTLPSLNSESNSESEPDSSSSDRPRTPNDDPQQVFITTLERQYRGNQVVEIPRYHWLFLTKTTEGWRLALIFSRMGSNRPSRGERPFAPTPPEESSDSFMAEAIRLWLRDLWLKSCSDRHNS